MPTSAEEARIQMLRALYERMPPPTPPPQVVDENENITFWHNNAPWQLKLALWTLVGFHMAVLAGNLAAIFFLPTMTPWYVALPIVSLLINFMFSAVSCPLTKLESFIRRKMGLPEIRYFVQHYFYKPSWRHARHAKT